MSDAKKRVYIDVDGCINALSSDPTAQLTHGATGWADESWSRKMINGYLITWSSQLVDELNALAAEGVEFRWLTTWCELAQTHIAPALGLGDWIITQGVLHNDPWRRYPGSGWWKRSLIERDLAEDPADLVAWIDDDHEYYQVPTAEHVLKVAPSPRFGITRTDLDSVKQHLALV